MASTRQMFMISLKFRLPVTRMIWLRQTEPGSDEGRTPLAFCCHVASSAE